MNASLQSKNPFTTSDVPYFRELAPHAQSLAELESRLKLAYGQLMGLQGRANKRSDDDFDDVIDDLAAEYDYGPDTWSDYDSWGLDKKKKRGLGSIA